MIKVFSQTDTDFSSNGDVVLRPLRAKVYKEDNGDYYLDLETSIDYADYLVEGNVVVAPTPQGDQAFYIDNVTKTRNKITTKAWHVFYRSENLLIADSYVVDKNCNDALDHLNSATMPASPFETLSDVGTVNSFRCVRQSLYEALQTVLERWGGHLVRDNFEIQIRTNIGQDNGVTVQYKKNLKEITVEENWDNVVTQLLPVGKDGVLLNELDATQSLYVTSEIQYAIPYTKTVSFSQDDILKEDFQNAEGETDETAYTQALIDDLLVQAQTYVEQNCVPQVNYTLKANVEKITDIGDTIEVKDDRLGLDILTNVISFTYDCILGQYTEIEFGNFTQSLSNLVSNIQSGVSNQIQEETQTIQATLSAELSQATSQIMGVLGSSYVIYDGNQILIVDSLPKESATNAIRINSAGIGFSTTGIAPESFNSAWLIDGTLDMQQVNVINLVADLIKGGTLKLGAHGDVSGILELYDDANNLVGKMDRNGLKMYGMDGSYVLMNDEVVFAGYDRNNTKLYWVEDEQFHMKQAVVSETITLCNQLRFIPIQITSGDNVVNEGIGLVSAQWS